MGIATMIEDIKQPANYSDIISSRKPMFKYLLFILIIAIGTAGQLMLKYGVSSCAAKIGPVNTLPEAFQAALVFLGNPVIVLTLFAYGLGAILYLLLLLKFDLTFILPALALVYLSVLFFSWLILHEQITAMRLVGTLIITFGVAVIFFTRQ
ncbi:MAG: hypothetical protein ABH823_02820 [bacterium]